MNNANALLFVSCGLAVAGDMIVTLWAKNQSRGFWMLLGGSFFTLFALGVWGYSMRAGCSASRAITVYTVFTTCAVTIVGVFRFGERLSLLNWTGVGMAVLALIFIGWKSGNP